MKNKLIEITKSQVVKNVIHTAVSITKAHSSTILTGITVSSNMAGIAITYKNSPIIHDVIAQTKRDLSCLDPKMENYDHYRKEYYRNGLKKLIPLTSPIIFFFSISTIAAIVNQKQSEAKISALTAALSVAESTIAEADMFKEEATKELGEEKVKSIEKEVEKRQLEEVRKANLLPFIKENEFLCMVPSFGCVFSCTPDRLENAMLKVNSVIEDNGAHGRSYGRTSDNGNEMATWYDIFEEIGLKAEQIPEYADNLAWEAGQIKKIDYKVVEGETEWGQKYYSLIIFTKPTFI